MAGDMESLAGIIKNVPADLDGCVKCVVSERGGVAKAASFLADLELLKGSGIDVRVIARYLERAVGGKLRLSREVRRQMKAVSRLDVGKMMKAGMRKADADCLEVVAGILGALDARDGEDELYSYFARLDRVVPGLIRRAVAGEKRRVRELRRLAKTNEENELLAAYEAFSSAGLGWLEEIKGVKLEELARGAAGLGSASGAAASGRGFRWGRGAPSTAVAFLPVIDVLMAGAPRRRVKKIVKKRRGRAEEEFVPLEDFEVSAGREEAAAGRVGAAFGSGAG